MDALDNAKNIWEIHNGKDTSDLKRDDVSLIIKSRIKKERNTIAQYMIASWVWQFIVYAFAVNMIIRFWNDMAVVLIGFIGIMLYIPFTVAYARFCSKSIHNSVNQISKIGSINQNIRVQYRTISSFFSFKKKFDLIGIPVTGFIIVMLFFEFNFIPYPVGRPVPAIIVFILTVIAFISAAHSENKKRFIVPLENLDAIIKEMENINS